MLELGGFTGTKTLKILSGVPVEWSPVVPMAGVSGCCCSTGQALLLRERSLAQPESPALALVVLPGRWPRHSAIFSEVIP